MVAADVLFRTAANTAAAAWANRPAYVSYTTHADVNVPTYHRHKTIDRAIEMRVDGDVAAIQDLPRGKRAYGHAFPLDPTFDAISYFRLRFQGIREAYSWVEGVVPITFTNPTPSPGVAVITTSLRNYYTTYAADSSDALAHIELQPLRALTYKNSSDFYLHDVWIDTATNLPTRVTYVGPDASFEVFYQRINATPVIRSIRYAQTLRGPFHLGRVDFTVDAKFDDYVFAERPKDEKLLPPAPGTTAAPLPQLTPQPDQK